MFCFGVARRTGIEYITRRHHPLASIVICIEVWRVGWNTEFKYFTRCHHSVYSMIIHVKYRVIFRLFNINKYCYIRNLDAIRSRAFSMHLDHLEIVQRLFESVV